MKKLFIVFAAVLTCLLVVSCGPQEKSPVKLLEKSLGKQQSDIPVPINYSYDRKHSRVEEFSSFRLCEMFYRSKSDAAHGVRAVTAFYKRMMPEYNWEYVEAASKQLNSLVFKKIDAADEYCRLFISREDDVTTIKVWIGNKKLVLAK